MYRHGVYLSNQMRRHHISITYNFGTIHDIYLFKYFYIQKNIVKIDK